MWMPPRWTTERKRQRELASSSVLNILLILYLILWTRHVVDVDFVFLLRKLKTSRAYAGWIGYNMRGDGGHILQAGTFTQSVVTNACSSMFLCGQQFPDLVVPSPRHPGLNEGCLTSICKKTAAKTCALSSGITLTAHHKELYILYSGIT